MNIPDIIGSWVRSANPTEEEVRIALDRLAYCESCENFKVNSLGIKECKGCGCFIDKKVYTKAGPEACPLKKWKI